ncbi:hypothetical protein PI124_g23141 [Phytophthora idaei]|nr:hypothetical protein PI124_g23141 [Phytophthora idaei]
MVVYVVCIVNFVENRKDKFEDGVGDHRLLNLEISKGVRSGLRRTMASHSCSSSFSGSNGSGERLPVPATIRLKRAMETHAALQAKTIQQMTHDSCSSPGPYLEATPSEKDHTSASAEISMSSASIDDLASQLRSLWQREKNQHQEQVNDFQSDDDSTLPDLKTTPQKIGSREKDELLLHLLEQQDTLRTQRSEAAALGEKIAAQLIHQQHELRQKYRERTSKLEDQLHEALHFNPQLRFAVQKLQRSRKREKDLKTMNDPLWD